MSTALRVALAWTPFYVLWVLFILTYDDGATLGSAAIGGLTAPLSAAVLGLLVWVLTDRVPWPDRLRPRFYLFHLAAGSIYAATWVLVGYIVAAARTGVSVTALLAESRVLGWQFILGLVLYGLVAGVSYAIRGQRRAREQERVAARAEAIAATARLDAVRARVNPHFLFNTLNTVLALVRDAPDEAERALERLADLLRYALDEGSDEDRPLAEEWAFTRDYLDLELLRFGDRMRVETDLAGEALAVPVAPLTLQPIVENAVRHAVGTSIRPVTVLIRAEVEGGRLVLSVSDDGPGVDPGDAERNRGSGLRGLRERLRAVHGDAATIEIRSRSGQGFHVRVAFPVDPAPAGAPPDRRRTG